MELLLTINLLVGILVLGSHIFGMPAALAAAGSLIAFYLIVDCLSWHFNKKENALNDFNRW
jgi:hypothetical protein